MKFEKALPWLLVESKSVPHEIRVFLMERKKKC